jgi:hypothetical protein
MDATEIRCGGETRQFSLRDALGDQRLWRARDLPQQASHATARDPSTCV